MYRAVIFDLGKVLVHFDFQRGYRALEGLCPYPAAEIPKRLATTGLVERFETGLVEPRDFVTQLCGILDLRVDYDQFCGIWSSIFTAPLVSEELLACSARVADTPMVLFSRREAQHHSCSLCAESGRMSESSHAMDAGHDALVPGCQLASNSRSRRASGLTMRG